MANSLCLLLLEQYLYFLDLRLWLLPRYHVLDIFSKNKKYSRFNIRTVSTEPIYYINTYSRTARWEENETT